MDLLIKKGEQLLKYGAFVKPFTRAYVSAFEFGLQFVTFISTIPAFLDLENMLNMDIADKICNFVKQFDDYERGEINPSKCRASPFSVVIS